MTKKITDSTLIRSISDATNPNSQVRYGFFLGAGASVESNIPSANTLCKNWLEAIESDNKNDIKEEWLKDDISAHYSNIFDERFLANPAQGAEAIQELISKSDPSIGYLFLAQILSETKHKFVITTNFDTLSEDSLFSIKGNKPLIIGHESLTKFSQTNNPVRPTIIKVHHDHLLAPCNDAKETKELSAGFAKTLEPILNEVNLIVLGYGGNDDSVMNYLEKNTNRKPIYWCCRNINKLSDKIKTLLTDKDFIVEIKGFDRFMLMLSQKLKLANLIDTEDINKSSLIEDAVKQAEKYQQQLKVLSKQNLEDEELQAIEEKLPFWWGYEEKIRKEKDQEKQNKIHLEGINAHPKSHELIGNYANFLCDIRQDYEQAEKYYKKALDIEPKDADFNGNYAVFLCDIRQDYGQAEEYYKKALAIEPRDADFNSNYAQSLLQTNQIKQAEYYLKIAFKYADHSSLLLELWFYRLAHYPKYREEAIIELDNLLASGEKLEDWDFSQNIAQAKQQGFEPIKLLQNYADKISHP